MAQFFALTTLNAANFESGDAASGEVLTADGSGGAAFAAPTGGGGGASFAYDGATITPGVYDSENYSYAFSVVLTLDGTPINTPVTYFAYVTQESAGTKPTNFYNFRLADEGGTVTGVAADTAANTLYLINYTPGGTPGLGVLLGEAMSADTVYVNIMLPSGLLVTSSALVIS